MGELLTFRFGGGDAVAPRLYERVPWQEVYNPAAHRSQILNFKESDIDRLGVSGLEGGAIDVLIKKLELRVKGFFGKGALGGHVSIIGADTSRTAAYLGIISLERKFGVFNIETSYSRETFNPSNQNQSLLEMDGLFLRPSIKHQLINFDIEFMAAFSKRKTNDRISGVGILSLLNLFPKGNYSLVVRPFYYQPTFFHFRGKAKAGDDITATDTFQFLLDNLLWEAGLYSSNRLGGEAETLLKLFRKTFLVKLGMGVSRRIRGTGNMVTVPFRTAHFQWFQIWQFNLPGYQGNLRTGGAGGFDLEFQGAYEQFTLTANIKSPAYFPRGILALSYKFPGIFKDLAMRLDYEILGMSSSFDISRPFHSFDIMTTSRVLVYLTYIISRSGFLYAFYEEEHIHAKGHFIKEAGVLDTHLLGIGFEMLFKGKIGVYPQIAHVIHKDTRSMINEFDEWEGSIEFKTIF